LTEVEKACVFVENVYAKQAMTRFVIYSRRVIMIRSSTEIKIVGLIVAVGAPIVLAAPAFAAGGDVAQVESFIRNVIKVIAGLAGLVATGFFVAGGFTYITSSGNPEQLDKAKRTLTWSAIGLAIVIAAFVISNIVTTLATQSFGG
jgi:hypothetical protein